MTVCDLCGSNSNKLVKWLTAMEWEPVKRYYADHPEPNPFSALPQAFALLSCTRCGLVFVTPRINDEVVNRFYEEYLAGKYKGYIHDYDTSYRSALFSKHLNLIKRYLPQRIPYSESHSLDVGCATGEFMRLASQDGFNSDGIEVSVTAGGRAMQYGKVFIGEVLVQLAKLPAGKYDLVTLIDALEHFRSPRQTMTLVSQKMKKGAIVFIEVPNFLAGGDEMSRHFYLFTKETMARLLETSGFELLHLESSTYYYNPQGVDVEVRDRFLNVVARRV